MEARVKPIPAFYCCYLLRSTVRHASLYVGSSPNPLRRLNQHNGKAKGGAVRTSRTSLRPWEMACIVAGFPSNIAALQFEWAWQNPHLTRHIAQDERLSFPVTQIKVNRQTGKTRKKPGRPRSSLIEKISNLHLLLRTTYFSRWPLEIRFFSEDVYQSWKAWSQRVDTQVRPEIKVILDLPQSQPGQQSEMEETNLTQKSPKRRKPDLIGQGGVEGVDATYAQYREVLEKSQFILDTGDGQKCDICENKLDLQNDLFTLCTANDCNSISHLTCLSSKFSHDSSHTNLVPERGKCPGCSTEVEWSHLMRVVSLRMRGGKEVQKLLKKKRVPKSSLAAEIMEEEEESDEDDGDDENLSDNANVLECDQIGENDDSDGDMITTAAGLLNMSNTSPGSTRFEIVIEDSEDEAL